MGLSKSEAYSVLELPLGASYEEIRSSYKRLALKWHPDKHNNSQEATKKFQEVSSAYKRLTSEDSDDEINLTPADMFDLFAHIVFQRNGMFGGYPGMYDSDNSCYSDDDEDDDDDDESVDEILQRMAQSYRKKSESKKPSEKGRPAHNLSEAEAMKNAKELIEEEERDRKKAEKRRAKKKRNKERKKEKEREKKAKDEKENIQQQKNNKKENIPTTTKAPPKEPSKKRNTTATSSTPTKTVNNNTKVSSGLKEQSVNNNTNLQQSTKMEPSSPKRHDEEDLSGNEEPTWDTNSAFFARAAGRNPMPPPSTSTATVKNSTPSTISQSSQNTKNISTQQPAAEQIDPVVLRSRQVAVKGNEMANVGNYQAAVDLFTQAINLDAKDFRFFGNRSYCYDRMGQYEKALQDADVAISLAPDWPKGYFRRGRALAGLKLYSDAESSFAQVLKLDKHCEDAMFELARVRVQQLEEMGFPQSQSEAAIQAYGTVQAALEALLAGKVSFPVSTEIYVSDGEDDAQKQQIRMVENGSVDDGPGRSLWVGNVNPEEVSERHLVQLFSRCGRVDNVRILPKRFCAFVNYDQAESAALALEKLQGYEMGGEQLLLRYPNNTGSPGSQPLAAASVPGKKKQPEGDLKQSMSKLSGPVNGDECYFWRTTGCYFADKCRFRHVPESKGVDLKRVEAKYGGKLRVTTPPSQ
ncbi:unnamed protein product [Pocillopora meandrina]|uniref:Uncharacterized protein n=1 Tax=Pocillopora meandrina TaxID=46732 RepID=A0AAU9X9K9_9CNID|nr:unnamed protein product [Pocillopora meandrina]